MKFRSVSPTALAVARACTSRWYVENVIGGRGFQSTAADLGTVCHSALEYYVKMAVLDETQPKTVQTLLDFFQMFYLKIFKDHDFERREYLDGVKMMKDWFKRNQDWDSFEVVSLEQKKSVTVTTPVGEVPCNFIIDRLDRVDDETMRVIDYKSWQNKLYPEDVRNTAQAKIYAVATKILYPEVKRVHVVYDQLRYNEVGVYFNEADLRDAWKWLVKQVRYLLALEPEDIKESINPECGFCVKKNNCGAFRKHKEAGGIHGLTNAQLLERAVEMTNTKKMIDSALADIDVLMRARVEDDEDNELNHVRKDGIEIEAKISPRFSSFVLEDDVRELVGERLYLKYAKLGTAGHKQLLDDPELAPEQVVALKELRKRSAKDPVLQIKEKKG